MTTLLVLTAACVVLPLGTGDASADASLDGAVAQTYTKACDSQTSAPCDVDRDDDLNEFTDSYQSNLSAAEGSASATTSQTTTLTQQAGALTNVESVSDLSAVAISRTGCAQPHIGCPDDADSRSKVTVDYLVPAGETVSISIVGTLTVEAGNGALDCGRARIDYTDDFSDFFQRREANAGSCASPSDQAQRVVNETFELDGREFGVHHFFELSASSRLNAEAHWDFEITLSDQCLVAADSSRAADACGGLAGTVTDGHGEPMIGLPVELFDGSNSLIATTTTAASGGYSFESAGIEPDTFTLRVTLRQAEAPLFKTHYRQGAEPVRVERQITPADFGNPVDIDLTDGPTLVSNLPNDARTDLDDVAVIHRRSKQYVDFLISTFALPPQDWGEPTIRTHAIESMFPPNKKCETSCYDPLIATLYINFSHSLFGSRDVPNKTGPENAEWHELTHHFAEIEGIANHADCYQVGDTNHGGWDNHSTCDSLAEGFPVFLPAFASRVIDGATDDTYATFGSLEWNSWKALSSDGTSEREDFAVAATLWDLADSDPTGPTFDQDATSVLPSGSGIVPIPATYRDEVTIGFETVSLLVRQSKPQTVKELYDALQASASVPAAVKNETVDLDQDTFGDVSPLDVVFLLHGFYIPEGPDDLYRLDTPIARTDHEPSGVPGVLLERHGAPHTPGSEVLIRNDGAFARIITVTVSDGVSDAVYTVFVPSGQEIVQLLDLPPFVTARIEPGDPLPPCGPDNDALLSITIEAPGIPPLETDSCQFAHAIEDSNGEPALTYAITPPDGTIQGPKNASALGEGIYNTNGSGQTSLTKVKRGKTATYRITAQNDSTAPDTLTVTGCRSSRGFKVSYFDEATNVTSHITGSGLSTGALAPGEFEALTLRIKVGKAGPKNKSCVVRATSQNSPSLQDVVVGKVKVKA